MTENELYHHGVKGMRWGVRRFQPYPPGSHGTFLGQSRDNDIRIKKGTEAYRLENNGTKGDSTKQTYVSFDKVDHMQYIADTMGCGDGGLSWSMEDAESGRSVKFKANKDILAPSYNKTMETFCNTVIEMGGAKKVAKDMFNHGGWDVRRGKEFVKKFNKAKTADVLDDAYIDFASRLMENSETKKHFISNLEKQGYNAVIDEWDARFGRKSSQYTKTPTIIFHRGDLTESVSRNFNKADQDYFYALYNNPDMLQAVNKNHKNAYNAWSKYMGKKTIDDLGKKLHGGYE